MSRRASLREAGVGFGDEAGASRGISVLLLKQVHLQKDVGANEEKGG